MARARNRPAAALARGARIEAEQRRFAREVEQRHGRVLSTLTAVMNAAVIEIPDGQAPALAALPGVRKVFPVHLAYPALDHALPLHSIPEAWGRMGGAGKAGAGVKIAILDTGIAADHAAFQDPTLKVPAGYPLVSRAENLAYTNNKIIVARSYEEIYQAGIADDVRDRYGHGTATAMCAAGVVNQGPQGQIAGAAPKAWIGVYKITALNSGVASEDAMAKAIDDALADGMDVLSLSYGSALVPPLETSAVADAISRATQMGMIVVTAAGNNGPSGNSLGDTGSVEAAISVGASDSDRTFGAGVTLANGATYQAYASNVPDTGTPVTAPLRDLSDIDSSGSLCGSLPAGSAAGRILIGPSGACTFEQQIGNAQKAGAVGVIVYPSAAVSPVYMAAGSATLPAVMISFEDAGAIRSAYRANGSLVARLALSGVPFANEPRRLSSYSSRGPTYKGAIKPDLTATGYVYTATQKSDESGGMYDRSGYIAISGTSFSAPIVAGAAAALKSARPGLTVAQYRSLLINNATPTCMQTGGVERVQRAGAGLLNLPGAISGTVTAYPTSLSYGTGGGTAGYYAPLTLTNIGNRTDTYTITSIPYDDAPPLQFSNTLLVNSLTRTLAVTIAPGHVKTIYAYWILNGVQPGEYEGQVHVQGTQDGANILVPYWYGVPSGVPAAMTVVSTPPEKVQTGTMSAVYLRVADTVGLPVVNTNALQFEGTVVSGGGAIGGLALSTMYPNLIYTTVRVGASPGVNIFRISVGGLPPVTLHVTAVTIPAAAASQSPARWNGPSQEAFQEAPAP